MRKFNEGKYQGRSVSMKIIVNLFERIQKLSLSYTGNGVHNLDHSVGFLNQSYIETQIRYRLFFS